MFQDTLSKLSEDISNLTTADLDREKCKSVYIPSWKELYPQLAQLQKESVCPPVWDGASCLPPTPAGHTAVLPCMTSAFGVDYSPGDNATRLCLSVSGWAERTDYLSCRPTNISCGPSPIPGLDIPTHIHIVGYSLSFVALVFALAIYIFLREMRCLRHKIHMGLFCAFGLSALNWILTLSWGDLVPRHYATPLLCATFTLTYFFHLTSFYWMFLEGLYLFLQVQYPLSLVSIKYKHFLMFGWGGPIVNMLVWFCLRIYDQSPEVMEEEEGCREQETECSFTEERPHSRWVMQAPMLLILCCNTFFLAWIMSIVFSKLRERTAMDHDRRHLKAAKALIFMMPVLGFGCILTLVVQPAVESLSNPLAEKISDALAAVIISTQGLVISLPYCFLNSEVQGVLANHWNRWRMVRTVGRSNLTTRTSLGTSTYLIGQKNNNQFSA